MNNSTDPKCNITLLTEYSICDNVLLEYLLSLEFQERGLLSYIYPILIGDYDSASAEYLDYFKSNCQPINLPNCVVKSIESNQLKYLNMLGLGSRLVENIEVKSIVEKIMKSQGNVTTGSKDVAFLKVADDLITLKA